MLQLWATCLQIKQAAAYFVFSSNKQTIQHAAAYFNTRPPVVILGCLCKEKQAAKQVAACLKQATTCTKQRVQMRGHLSQQAGASISQNWRPLVSHLYTNSLCKLSDQISHGKKKLTDFMSIVKTFQKYVIEILRVTKSLIFALDHFVPLKL